MPFVIVIETEATSYVWELPTGVNPVLGTVVGTPTVRLYSTYPFLTTISSAPTAVGNVFYRVTETVYSSGIVIQTATRSVVGGTLANGVPVTAVTNATVTNLTNEGATINHAFPIVTTSSASRAIQVDFAVVVVPFVIVIEAGATGKAFVKVIVFATPLQPASFTA